MQSIKDLADKFVPFLRHELDELVKTVRDNKDGLEKFGADWKKLQDELSDGGSSQNTSKKEGA